MRKRMDVAAPPPGRTVFRRLRKLAESFPRLPSVAVLRGLLAWLLAVLLALAPLAARPCSVHFCGGAGQPSAYSTDTVATVSRPEAELRARALKRTTAFADPPRDSPAVIAGSAPRQSFHRPRIDLAARAEFRPQAASAYCSRAPPSRLPIG